MISFCFQSTAFSKLSQYTILIASSTLNVGRVTDAGVGSVVLRHAELSIAIGPAALRFAFANGPLYVDYLPKSKRR